MREPDSDGPVGVADVEVIACPAEHEKGRDCMNLVVIRKFNVWQHTSSYLR